MAQGDFLELNEEPRHQSPQMQMVSLSDFVPDLPISLFIFLLCSFAL